MIGMVAEQIFMDKDTKKVNTEKIIESLKTILQYLFTVIVELANYSFYFLVFVSCMTYLISMKEDIIQISVSYLPIEEPSTKSHIVSSLFKNIRGVFVSPLKISLTLSLVSWVILDFFGVKYLYVYSFMAAIIPFIPLCSVSILGVPAAVYLYLSGSNLSWAVM